MGEKKVFPSAVEKRGSQAVGAAWVSVSSAEPGNSCRL